MEHYNIHFSPTGGTRKVADILCCALDGEFNEIDLCRNIEQTSLGEDDICLVSVPSYGGRVPITAIERLKKISGNGAKAVLNCVYGNRAWEDTLTELQDTLEEQGFRCVAALATVAEHSIFRQFAAGRPDEKDKSELLEMAGEYYRHFKGNVYRVLHIAKHSETLEEMVVYQAMYGERGIWIRPKSMFEEVIERDGKTFRRFSPISAEEAEKIIEGN